VVRNLTERKEMEEQLLSNERLRVMGQIASGITHDVNNALTPILGYSELLSKSNSHRSNEEYLVKTLGVIHTSAQDAAAVVARLREFYRARSEHEVVVPVDLNSVARQAAALAEIRRKEREFEIGKLITVVTELDPVGALVLGREDELRQALLNLVFNSMDALANGGTVTIGTRRANDGTVTLNVQDDGVGMTPDALARCMEPFFTTKG
jgi:signal transduction histidine kinase